MASLPSRRLSSRDTGAAPTTPKSALRLCVYNYKGGAAKTTIVVNTAESRESER